MSKSIIKQQTREFPPKEQPKAGKETSRVIVKETELEILISEVSLHLLTAHHFLQGKGSPFRLEPSVLKKLLSA